MLTIFQYLLYLKRYISLPIILILSLWVAACSDVASTDKTLMASVAISLPSNIEVDETSVFAVKLSDPIHAFNIGALTSDKSYQIKNIRMKNAALLENYSSADSCIDGSGHYKIFSNSCRLFFAVTPKQIGNLPIEVSIYLTNDQVIKKTMHVNVKRDGSSLLAFPMIDFLDADNDIFIDKNQDSIAIFNTNNQPLNNVIVSQGETILGRVLNIPPFSTQSIMITRPVTLFKNTQNNHLALNAGNMISPITLREPPYDNGLRFNDIYIDSPNKSYYLTIVPKQNFKIETVENNLPPGVSIVGKNPFIASTVLESGHKYFLTLKATKSSYGKGSFSIDAELNNTVYKVSSNIEVAPATITTTAPIFLKSGNYAFVFKNTSPFAWQNFNADNFDASNLTDDKNFNYIPKPQDCHTIKSLKAGQSCNVTYRYNNIADTTSQYQFILKALKSNLAADISIPINIFPLNHKFWRFYHQIKRNTYRYTLYNNTDSPVVTQLTTDHVNIQWNSNCKIKKDLVTVPKNGICQFEASSQNTNGIISIKNPLYETVDHLSIIPGFVVAAKNQLYTISGEQGQEQTRVNLKNFNNSIQRIISTAIDANSHIYLATNIPNKLFKYSHGHLISLSIDADNYPQYIQYVVYNQKVNALLAISYNPNNDANNIYQVSGDMSDVYKLAKLKGSVAEVGIDDNGIIAIALNDNHRSSIVYAYLSSNPKKSSLTAPKIIFDSSQYVTHLFFKGNEGYLLTNLTGKINWYGFDTSNTSKIDLIPHQIDIDKVSPYGLLGGIVKTDKALYISNIRSQSGHYLLYREHEGKANYLRSNYWYEGILPSLEGVFYNAEDKDGAYAIGHWPGNQSKNLSNIPPLLTLTDKPLDMHNLFNTVLTSNDYSVYLDKKIVMQEGQVKQIKPVILPEAAKLNFKWGGSGLKYFKPDQLNIENITLTAPSYHLGSNSYDIELSVSDNAGNKQQIFTTIEVTSNDSYKPTVTITANNSVTESKEITLTAKATAKGGRTIPADGYHWNVPAEWTIVGAANQQTLTITAPIYQNAGQQGQITLTATDSTQEKSNSTSHNITVNPNDALQPTANAGGNQSVTEGQTFKVNGSATAQGKRKIASFLWSGTGAAYLDHRDSATPTFTAPAYQGTKDNYTLTLTVTDSAGIQSKPATAQYTVTSDKSLQPTVTITANNSVTESKEITLTAKATAKGGRTIPADGYHWTVPSQWTIVGAANQQKITLKAPIYQKAGQQGQITLTATDSTGEKSNSTSHNITVNPDDALQPTANAGGNQSVTEGQTFKVNATATAQGKRKIASFLWSGTGAAYLDHRDSATPTFTAPAYQGTKDNYTLTLTVTDSAGIQSKPATAQYTVTSDKSLQPTVTITANNSVTESKEITLTAKATAKGGRTIPADGYHWNVPAEWTIVGAANQQTLTITAPIYQNAGQQGQITLTVTDSTGEKSNSTSHNITVNPDDALQPTANAGGNQSVTEGQTFKVNATATAQGKRKIASFLWSGTGAAYLDHRDSATPTFTAPAYQGTKDNYTLTLTVTDSAGIISKVSTVHYTVISSGNPKVSLQGYQTTSPVVIGTGSIKLTANTQNIPGRYIPIDGYHWLIPSGWSVEGANNQKTITLRSPAYTKIGQYGTIKLSVTDNTGIKSNQITTYIYVSQSAIVPKTLYFDIDHITDQIDMSGLSSMFNSGSGQRFSYLLDKENTNKTSGAPENGVWDSTRYNIDSVPTNFTVYNVIDQDGNDYTVKFKAGTGLSPASLLLINSYANSGVDDDARLTVKPLVDALPKNKILTGNIYLLGYYWNLGVKINLDIPFRINTFSKPQVSISSDDSVIESKEITLTANPVLDGNRSIPANNYHWGYPNDWRVIGANNQENITLMAPAYSSPNQKAEITVSVKDSTGLVSNSAKKIIKIQQNADIKADMHVCNNNTSCQDRGFYYYYNDTPNVNVVIKFNNN